MKIAAIDQGTSSTRLAVIDSDGLSELRCSLAHRQFHPFEDWTEHDPLELLRNVKTCVEAAGEVNAIGLANQGESCLAWDAVTLEPLSRVIVWQDNRTREGVEQMRRDGLERKTLARSGLPLSPYFSASKFRWLLKMLPSVEAARQRGRLHLGTTDTYLLEHLTGNFVTDLSTASRTALLNLSAGCWDRTLCHIFGVPIESLPAIRSTAGPFGAIGHIPLTASVVDQQAALFGHGCRHRGDAKITFGTGAFMLAVTGSEILRERTEGLLPTVAWKLGDDVTFALDGGVYHAGSVVTWLCSLGLVHRAEDLNTFQATPAISRGLAFVPALSGLACPHWDASAGALWIGMTGGTTSLDLCQAALEGVALRTLEVISAMDRSVALSSSLSIDGGMARNEYFLQFLANVSGRQILAHCNDELTAFGCAQLAALGAGHRFAENRSAPRIYSPRDVPRLLWIERFRRAIARAKTWHADEE